MKDWRIKAKEEGRICPECSQPVSIQQWVRMNRRFFHKKGKVDVCYDCHLKHWDYPVIDLHGTAGNVFKDNADREGLDWIRVHGK
jgi:ssDNA-binding Zn-finger/Zn-ribbon topoisomerase 1